MTSYAPLLLAAAAIVTPAAATAAHHHHRAPRSAHVRAHDLRDPRGRACLKAPVEVVAGTDSATFSLTNCDGSTASWAVEHLSILARPPSAQASKKLNWLTMRGRGGELAPGVRRLDPRLAQRLQAVVDHFHQASEARIVLLSGLRARGAGNYHARGRALDFQVEGVDNGALVAFCKTLPDTGCGYYPNGTFIHMDVRDTGTGNVSWTDLSHPGEGSRSAGAAKKVDAPLPPLPKHEADQDVSLPAASVETRAL